MHALQKSNPKVNILSISHSEVLMNDKYLLHIGLAALAILGIAVGIVAAISTEMGPPTNSSDMANTTTKANIVPVQAQASDNQNHVTSSLESQPIVNNPANGNGVQDVDLKNLASMVHLDQAKHQGPNKDQWNQALPVAQKLLQGTCDCEQRNWLKQFVTMGNYALSDSSQYYQSAQLMDTLPLNDQDLHLHYNSK